MFWAERGDYVVRRDEEVEGVYFLLQGQVPFFFCVFGKYYIFQKGLVWLNSVFFVSLYVFAGSGCGISRRSRLLLLLGVRFETIWFLRPWYFWECLLSRCCCCLTTGLLFLFSSLLSLYSAFCWPPPPHVSSFAADMLPAHVSSFFFAWHQPYLWFR